MRKKHSCGEKNSNLRHDIWRRRSPFNPPELTAPKADSKFELFASILDNIALASSTEPSLLSTCQIIISPVKQRSRDQYLLP
mmetsp:Transcript_30949/g.118754  ORF Transcript_30949/g.118754 Transcript_30949/m.118754 type:complete len:82 (+) Transcript_30949:1468-1713(+)